MRFYGTKEYKCDKCNFMLYKIKNGYICNNCENFKGCCDGCNSINTKLIGWNNPFKLSKKETLWFKQPYKQYKDEVWYKPSLLEETDRYTRFLFECNECTKNYVNKNRVIYKEEKKISVGSYE